MAKFAIIINGFDQPGVNQTSHIKNVELSLTNVFETPENDYETFVASPEKPDAVHDHYAKPTLEGIMELVRKLKSKISKEDELVIYDANQSLPTDFDFDSICRMLDTINYGSRVVITNQRGGNMSSFFTDDPKTLFISSMQGNDSDSCRNYILDFWVRATGIADADGDGKVGWLDRYAALAASSGHIGAAAPTARSEKCNPQFIASTDISPMDFLKIAPVMIKVGRENEAADIFQKAIEFAEKTQSPETFEKITSLLCETWFPQRGSAVFESLFASVGKIKNRGIRLMSISKVSAAITRELIEHGDANDAILAIGRIKNNETKFFVLREITNTLVAIREDMSREGKSNNVFALFISLIREKRGPEALEIRSLFFRNIAFNLAVVGRREELEQFISAACDVPFNPPALREIATSLARARLKDKSAEVFELAINSTERLFNEAAESDERTTQLLVFTIAKIAAAVKDAKITDCKVFKRLFSVARLIKDPAARQKVFTGILENFPAVVSANCWDNHTCSQVVVKSIPIRDELGRSPEGDFLGGLFSAADRIENPAVRTRVYNGIATELLELGDKDRAAEVFLRSIDVIKSIDNLSERSKSFVETADVVISAREKLGDKITPVLEALLTAADGLPPIVYSTWLGELALKLGVAGMKEKAKELFEKAMESAGQVEAPFERSKLFVGLASKLTAIGFLGEEFENMAFDAFMKSIDAVERIEELFYIFPAFENIIKVLDKERPTDKTAKIFQRLLDSARRIKDDGTREKTLKRVRDTIKAIGLQTLIEIQH